MFDGRWKSRIEDGLKPVGTGLRRTGLKADHLTALGLLVAAGASVAIANGALRLGLVLVICAGLPDLLDGALAKASGTAGPRGAFFDSVADRVTDALLFGGVAWYLGARYGFHQSMLALAVLGASSVISYERARAEALGFNARGGLMERAERVILLCLGLLFSNLLLIPVLWIMLVLTVVTAVQRFVKVWRQASGMPSIAEVAAERAAARRAQRAQRSRRTSRPMSTRSSGSRPRRR